MGTTKLGLYQGALLLLSERALHSTAGLTEDRESRRVLDRIWDRNFITRVLEKGQWQWATVSAMIDPNPSIARQFGYEYPFPHPPDYVRTVGLSSDEYFTEPLTRFVDERGYWWSDVNPLYVRYISNDKEYGGDLSLWPDSFALYAESVMAREAAPRITGVTVSVEALEKVVKQRYKEATGIDGINRPTVFPSRGTWNSSRHGRYSVQAGPWVIPPTS